MKKKKCIAAGALAAFLLCESLFTPNLAGMGAGLLKVQAAAANVALNKEVTSSANESATWSADKAVDGDKTSDSGRWSSGDMGTNRDNPQWLVIDLSAATTNVESINIYFNLKAWSTEYQIQTSDSTTGMQNTIDGICDIGMASRELKDSETEAGLTATVIANDGIAVVVNNDNPIDELTSDQVKSVFTGETTTWADLEK